MGVGHRVKSINNPDMRVTIIKVLRLMTDENFRFSPSPFIESGLYCRLRSSCVSTFPPRRCWTTPWRWRRSPPAKNLIWFWTWTVLLAWLLSTYSAILAASLGIHVVFFSVYGLFADGLFVCLPFRRREEAQEYIEIGTINGLFVLGRCTGFIGTCASGFNSAFSSVVLIHHHIYVFILLSFEQQQATIWIKSDWSKDSTAIRGTTFPTSCRKSIPNRRKEGKVAFQKKTEELFVVRCDKRFEKKKTKKEFLTSTLLWCTSSAPKLLSRLYVALVDRRRHAHTHTRLKIKKYVFQVTNFALLVLTNPFRKENHSHILFVIF